MKKAKYIQRIEQLLSQGKIKSAIDELISQSKKVNDNIIHDEAILILTHFNANENELNADTISIESYEQRRNKIIASLEKLVVKFILSNDKDGCQHGKPAVNLQAEGSARR